MINREEKKRLQQLIALAMNVDPKLVLDTFLRVYGDTY